MTAPHPGSRRSRRKTRAKLGGSKPRMRKRAENRPACAVAKIRNKGAAYARRAMREAR